MHVRFDHFELHIRIEMRVESHVDDDIPPIREFIRHLLGIDTEKRPRTAEDDDLFAALVFDQDVVLIGEVGMPVVIRPFGRFHRIDMNRL